MRPTVDIDDETYEEVQDYANRNGLRKPRAFGELIEAGLEAEGVPEVEDDG